MTTREEIEAAIEIVKNHRDKRRFNPADVLLPAMRMLADWAISERSERQRRIEAAAEELDSVLTELTCVASPEARQAAIARIITKHLEQT